MNAEETEVAYEVERIVRSKLGDVLATLVTYAMERERLRWTEALSECAPPGFHGVPDGQDPLAAVKRFVAHVTRSAPPAPAPSGVVCGDMSSNAKSCVLKPGHAGPHRSGSTWLAAAKPVCATCHRDANHIGGRFGPPCPDCAKGGA